MAKDRKAPKEQRAFVLDLDSHKQLEDLNQLLAAGWRMRSTQLVSDTNGARSLVFLERSARVEDRPLPGSPV